MSDSGIVSIHGKEYRTVAMRVGMLRDDEDTKLYSIESEVLNASELVQVKATIKDADGRVVATGLAEENRSFGNINKTSALENCETSAVGRALAFLGLGGTEIASADEVANAIEQQDIAKAMEPIVKHNVAVRDNIESVNFIKQGIALDDYSLAAEAWFELPEDTKKALWIAPTKGGIFTTKEREIMKSSEFKQAHFGGEQ